MKKYLTLDPLSAKALPVYITVLMFGVILYITQVHWQPEQISAFIVQFGASGWFIYAFLVMLANIAAPISASPLLLLGFSLFGQWAIWLFALGNLGAMAINFWLARQFGRRLIVRFVGQDSMNKIDELSKHYGLAALFMIRLFMPGISDLASYAFGLSQINFRPYIIISIIATLPSNFLFFYFSQEESSSIQLLLLQLIIAGVLSAIYLLARYTWNKFIRLLLYGKMD